eukprot:2430392-Lingulodinium_polyedra.AAC.1
MLQSPVRRIVEHAPHAQLTGSEVALPAIGEDDDRRQTRQVQGYDPRYSFTNERAPEGKHMAQASVQAEFMTCRILA